MPNDIPAVFHNSANYYYHSIIKQLENQFEGEFECIGEVKEKYKTSSVPIKKETMKIDKDGNKTVDTISYKTKFIDSARFMASPVSNLVDNLTGGIHKIKCTKFVFFS